MLLSKMAHIGEKYIEATSEKNPWCKLNTTLQSSDYQGMKVEKCKY